MGFTRRRSDRPDQARFRLGSNLEHLESRVLLATSPRRNSSSTPSDLPARTISHFSPPIRNNHPIGTGDRQLSFLDNDGKVVSGKDRKGDEYTITVHGPGVAIVTDATPNDGVLDDDIDTIQLVGTDLNNAFSPARSCRLSGAHRRHGVVQPPVQPRGWPRSSSTASRWRRRSPDRRDARRHRTRAILLRAGSGSPSSTTSWRRSTWRLPTAVQYHDRRGAGRAEDSARRHLQHRLQQAAARIPTAPQRRRRSTSWSTARSGASRSSRPPRRRSTRISAGLPDGLDHRSTAIQALGIDRLKVVGSARNLTASRTGALFRTRLRRHEPHRPRRLRRQRRRPRARRHGPIGRLRFARGLGDPTVRARRQPHSARPRRPSDTRARADRRPGHGQRYPPLEAGPRQPGLADGGRLRLRPAAPAGEHPVLLEAGQRLYLGDLASAGSIGEVTVVGDAANSEIKSGFDYPSFVAGLEGTRAGSRIGPFRYRGDLVDGVISATYRPVERVYGTRPTSPDTAQSGVTWRQRCETGRSPRSATAARASSPARRLSAPARGGPVRRVSHHLGSLIAAGRLPM